MPLKPSTDKSFTPLEEGTYELKLVALEDAEPGQYGARMKWIFNAKNKATGQVEKDDEGNPYEWWQFTSDNMGPKSTARKWSQALLGRELEEGEDVSEELVGKRMSAVIGPNDNDYTTILSCKSMAAAAKKGAPAKKAAPAPEPEEPEEDADDGDEPF